MVPHDTQRHDAQEGAQATQLFLVIIGVVGVSSSGPLMAGATAVPALAMSLWRTGLGSIAVATVALARHRTELVGLARRERVRCGFSGLLLACHFAAWTSSLRLTSVASATSLVCLQVAWVVVLARMSGHQIARGIWVGLVCSLAGVLVIAGIDTSVSTQALGGDLLAVLGGVFGAMYVTVGSRVRERITTTAYTFFCYTVCALTLLVACLLDRTQLGGYDARGWWIIIAVTVGSQLLGHSVFNHLLAVMSPTVVSMVLLLEVPGAALLAAVFLGQTPPVAVYGGLAMICGGLALVVRARAAARPSQIVEAPLD